METEFCRNTNFFKFLVLLLQMQISHISSCDGIRILKLPFPSFLFSFPLILLPFIYLFLLCPALPLFSLYFSFNAVNVLEVKILKIYE